MSSQVCRSASRAVRSFLSASKGSRFYSKGSTVAAAATVSLTRKAPLFASNIGKSESGNGSRAWLSGVRALPADGNLESFSEKLAPFLRPKCALWSCCEPAEGLGFCPDYCCDSHWVRAIEGGRSGKTPIMRPGGIGVKDGPLFATVCAKLLGKHVGIPNCEGAASTKPPWNDPEFSLSFLDYERLRDGFFLTSPEGVWIVETGNPQISRDVFGMNQSQ